VSLLGRRTSGFQELLECRLVQARPGNVPIAVEI
jgi:hypothetical protein